MLLRLDGEGSLFRQTYRALRAAILDGRIRPRAPLPPTRVLAAELGISRNTVLQAYRQLLDEGYLVARQGSGTYVAEILPEDHVRLRAQSAGHRDGRRRSRSLRLSKHAERLLGASSRPIAWGLSRRHLPYDFRYGEPAFGELPLDDWWRVQARRARRASAAQLGYGAPGGTLELREALVRYLAQSRGVRCTADQVLIVNGTQQAIDLVVRVLVDPGDRIAVEEPHYTGFSLVLAAHGAEVERVPVDADGLCVSRLEEGPPVRGVFVTPSHQFPTGALLPLARRLALLAYAARRSAFVMEDDYDGELRYEGPPVECLQGLDEEGRVFYVGSASKVLFPSLRLAWLIAPADVVPALQRAKALTDTGTSVLDQLALADFIADGHLERHIRRSRTKNAARREALSRAIERHLSGKAILAGTEAGLHGFVSVPSVPVRREGEFRRKCAEQGVGIYSVVPYYSAPPDRAAFLLGFSSLAEPAIDEGVRRIARVLDRFRTR